MSAPALQGEILSPRLTDAQMEQCRRHLAALSRIVGPCQGKHDLYAGHAADVMNQIDAIEHDLNEMRREGTRG